MTDIASLGLAVDSRQVTNANAALDQLAAKSAAAGAATDKLAGSGAKSETVMRAIDSAAKRQGISTAEMTARVNAATASHAKLTTAAGTAVAGISSLANASAGSGSGSGDGSLASASDKSSTALERLGNTLTRRVLFAFAAKEARDLAAYIWNLNTAVAATADSATRAGTGGGAFQGLQTSAAYKGVDNSTFNSAMVAFNVQVDLAKNGIGALQILLKSNGKTVSDTATTFGVVADLVKNAGSEAQKFAILQQAGLPANAAFVKFMEQGSAAIKAQGDAAGKLSQKQLDEAAKIDAAWQQGWVNFENWGKRSIVNVFTALSNAKKYNPFGPDEKVGGPNPAGIVTRGADLIAPGPNKPTFDPALALQQNAQAQARLTVLGQLLTVEQQVKQTDLTLAAAGINLTGVNTKQKAALENLTRAQAENTLVQNQATIGTFNLAAANKAAADTLQSWIDRKLLDPNNPTQYAAALTVLNKQTEQLGETAQIAGAKFEQLKRYQLDAANGRTAFDKFATSSLDTVTNGFTDAIMRVKSFQDAVRDMTRSVLSDLIKIALRSAIFGPAAGILGNAASSLGFGGGINANGSIAGAVGATSVGGAPLVGYAGGTNYAPGGLAMVNEGGRGEIIDLPSGSRVIPHDVSMRMASSGGGVSFGDTNLIIQGNADDKMLQAMQRELASHRTFIAQQVKQSSSQARFASTGVG